MYMHVHVHVWNVYIIILYTTKIFFRRSFFLYSPCPNLESIKDALFYKFKTPTIAWSELQCHVGMIALDLVYRHVHCIVAVNEVNIKFLFSLYDCSSVRALPFHTIALFVRECISIVILVCAQDAIVSGIAKQFHRVGQ